VAPLSFTAGQARSRRGFGALVARHQAYLFFPLLLLEALHLHANSVKAVLGTRRLAHRPAEAALLALHAGGYLTAVLLVLAQGWHPLESSLGEHGSWSTTAALLDHS
jgi:hypothetical protein